MFDKLLERGNKQLNDVSNGSLLVAERQTRIDELEKLLAKRDKQLGQASSLIERQLNVIDKFNLETVGETATDLLPDVETPLEDGVETMTRIYEQTPENYGIQFHKAVQGVSSARIELAQFDPIYRFYVIHPTDSLTLELNGIPNPAQRHKLGIMLAKWFDNLKEGKNKNSLRTIRRIDNQESTGKLLTCGRVWPQRKCKCEQRFAKDKLLTSLKDTTEGINKVRQDKETVESALDGLLDDPPVATTIDPSMAYLENLLGNDKPTENKVDKAKTRKELFFSIHDKSKGSFVAYDLAKAAIRISANKGVSHTGYLDRSYDAIIKIACGSDKIDDKMLAKSVASKA